MAKNELKRKMSFIRSLRYSLDMTLEEAVNSTMSNPEFCFAANVISLRWK